MDAARRGFLRGRFRQFANVPRPPWAVAGAEFQTRCTRCNDCIGACPTAILRVGDGGYPTVDFSHGECTFCGECALACAPRAIDRAAGAQPWQLKARIGPACIAAKGVECRICGEVCEARAIRFRPALGGISAPNLDEAACTGCGACVAPCPVDAIVVSHPGAMEITA